MAPDEHRKRPGLRRVVGLPALVLYGLGTTIGAGIYALLGEVAAAAGSLTPYAFLTAAVLAAATALSFAELVQRYPTAGAAAYFVSEGLNSKALGLLVGALVVAAGLVSAAALLNACAGYLGNLITAPAPLLLLVVLTVLTLVCLWGIGQSVALAGLICLLEVGGLLWMATLAYMAPETDAMSVVTMGAVAAPVRPGVVPAIGLSPWQQLATVFAGAVLAFYAYIGFEDMVEVAEEVRDVRRTLPLAIVLTLLLTTGLYLYLVIAALGALGIEQLAQSKAPLAALSEHLLGGKPIAITVIAVAAISNGVLIQMIMVSRVLYGLASRGQAPRWLAVVSGRTQTPLLATLAASIVIALLALSGSVSSLAQGTSLLMLIVFVFVNLALARLKLQAPPATRGWLPVSVPLFGVLACAALALMSLLTLAA